jgi:hypothetical protein
LYAKKPGLFTKKGKTTGFYSEQARIGGNVEKGGVSARDAKNIGDTRHMAFNHGAEPDAVDSLLCKRLLTLNSAQ